MNAIASFRKCTLSDEDLLKEIDRQTDLIFTDQKIPSRNVPARPDQDYDLLIGELLLRFKDRNTTLTFTPQKADAGSMVEELKNILEAFEWTFYNMGTAHTSDHFNIPANGIEQLKTLIAGYAAASKPSDWVKLGDGCKMPDYDEPVLWLQENGNYVVDSLDKDGNPWLFEKQGAIGEPSNDDEYVGNVVTHWRYLPQTPKL